MGSVGAKELQTGPEQEHLHVWSRMESKVLPQIRIGWWTSCKVRKILILKVPVHVWQWQECCHGTSFQGCSLNHLYYTMDIHTVFKYSFLVAFLKSIVFPNRQEEYEKYFLVCIQQSRAFSSYLDNKETAIGADLWQLLPLVTWDTQVVQSCANDIFLPTFSVLISGKSTSEIINKSTAIKTIFCTRGIQKSMEYLFFFIIIFIFTSNPK